MDPAAIVSSVDTAEIEADVRWLSGEEALADGPIRSRDLHHPDLGRAKVALVDALSAVPGLVVEEEPFEVRGVQGALGGVANVIAELPGADPSLPVLVLGAHYDSIASADPSWTDPSLMAAPGADDDASGVAATLAVARAMGAYAPGFDRTVRFALFSAEEYGLQGSFAHVDALDVPVEGMIMLDPVGYNPGGLSWMWVVSEGGDSALSGGIGDASLGAAVQFNPVDAADIGGDARSDHFPFWEAGIEAVHVASFPQPPTYHTMDDTVANVDFAFTREVAVAIGAYLAGAAGPRAEDVPRGCASSAGGPPGMGGVALSALVALLSARRRARGTRS